MRLSKDIKDKIFVIKKDSPLVIGVNTDTIFIASDIPTILPTVMKPKKEPDVFEFYVL